MALNRWTTAFLLLSVGLLIAWPWVVGPAPNSNIRAVLIQHGLRMVVYFGIVCTSFLVTAYLALLVARQTRREYMEDTVDNFKHLVEGSLRDHERPRTLDDDAAGDRP
ncbi:MAG: hypothetical protein JNM85_01440 [Chthonomonas sp.]|nr:hypothetical protein [Chthonomonas sp.]